MNAADDLLPLAGGSTSVLPDPAADIGVNADCDLMRLNSPNSELWNRGGGYDWHFHAIPNGRKNIHFSGHGFIAGTVKEKGQSDQPLVRRVQLVSENARVLVAETWSDATGAYRFDQIDPSQRYTVVSYDYFKLAEDKSVGLERTATLIKQARADFPNNLLIDNGDTIQGSALADYQALVSPLACNQKLATYKAMDAIGFDAGTLGNHEFNYGLPYLSQVTGTKFNVEGMEAVATKPRAAASRS